jgi:diacylglycerol kinase family enzyme
MNKRAIIVYNPLTKTEPWLPGLASALCDRGDLIVGFFAHDHKKTPADLLGLIKKNPDLVIAAGGDGTVRFAVAALAQAKSDIPLAIIPIGTANVLARNIGVLSEGVMATSLADAMDTICSGKRLRINLGMMNGEYFAVTAGAGPLSDAFVTPKSVEKNTFKLLAYARSVIQAIFLPRSEFRVSIEGRSFTILASGIFVANVQDFGIGRTPDINELVEAGLSINIIRPKNFVDCVDSSFGFVRRNDYEQPEVFVRKVQEGQIEVLSVSKRFSWFYRFLGSLSGDPSHRDAVQKIEAKVIAMIDGEECGTTPMRFEIVPNAVTVLVPSVKEIAPNAVLPSKAAWVICLRGFHE